MNIGPIKTISCAHKNLSYSYHPQLCLGLSLSTIFLAPKAPQEEDRAQKRKGNLTVLFGDKSDGHMSGYCLVVVCYCTYSLDKFHCLWYKTPNGTGSLKVKQESMLINVGHPEQCTGVWNAVALLRQDSKAALNPHLQLTNLEESGAALGLSPHVWMMPTQSTQVHRK